MAVESDADQPLGSMAGSPTSHAKQRRSLHRTLRESSHRRGHKGRDSSSTILSEDTQDSEGLTRDKGSFTVHGKKASVIQFGGDWHNSTAEERLKRKKELQDAAEALAPDDRDAYSVLSNNTATAPSPRGDASVDSAPRKLSIGTARQRHASAQTITPENYKDSLEHQDDSNSDKSEMSDIAEESQERTSAEQAENKRKDAPMKIDIMVGGSPPPDLTSPTTTNLVQM
jgi:hypothetical protein